MKTGKPNVLVWWKKGDAWIWVNGAAVAVSIIAVMGLLLLLAVKGLGHFWPDDILETRYRAPGADAAEEIVLIGEIVDREMVSGAQLVSAGIGVADESRQYSRLLLKLGNRDLTGTDFGWFLEEGFAKVTYPHDLMVLERREWGNFYGRLNRILENGNVVFSRQGAGEVLLLKEFQTRLQRAQTIKSEILQLEKKEIGSINYRMERLRLNLRRLEIEKVDAVTMEVRRDQSSAEKELLDREYAVLQERLGALYQEAGRDQAIMIAMDGREVSIPLGNIVRALQPNRLSISEKMGVYYEKVKEFLLDDPREANTEGGIFPAIFGTVMMVMLMSIIVTPFGVVAAIYLREYAKQGFVTRAIRIAVNNLAGVPSIVYGVFGLGFFVYFLGEKIDHAFFPEALPSPTFGAPGLLWASLTLALLTVPVVIVATEEGLARIPRTVREGSLALGATKFETLWRVVLPMASPAMMTGLILAVARAAGEVAPLMLVGVVKLAPSLPLDGNYPYFHLDQKFMHLGFHIYDVGFQSPNIEAARPLVYATALLLVIVIALLNYFAVAIRNHLREKYKSLEH